MNVKPGDLAIVVKSIFEENIGRIVTVIESSPHNDHGFDWHVYSVRKIKGQFADSGGIDYQHYAHCRDDSLRPISGLPDEFTTDEEQPIQEIA